jgi:hypothetical protein
VSNRAIFYVPGSATMPCFSISVHFRGNSIQVPSHEPFTRPIGPFPIKVNQGQSRCFLNQNAHHSITQILCRSTKVFLFRLGLHELATARHFGIDYWDDP